MPRQGGWLDQPLDLLVRFDLYSMVDSVFRYKSAKDSDWSKFTNWQMELIKWLEDNDD